MQTQILKTFRSWSPAPSLSRPVCDYKSNTGYSLAMLGVLKTSFTPNLNLDELVCFAKTMGMYEPLSCLYNTETWF